MLVLPFSCFEMPIFNNTLPSQTHYLCKTSKRPAVVVIIVIIIIIIIIIQSSTGRRFAKQMLFSGSLLERC